MILWLLAFTFYGDSQEISNAAALVKQPAAAGIMRFYDCMLSSAVEGLVNNLTSVFNVTRSSSICGKI